MKRKMTTSLDDLMPLLATELYAKPDVFLRELVSNSFDAILQREREVAEEPHQRRIAVRRSAAGIVVVADNGIGMTDVELVDFLSCVGRGLTSIRAATDDRFIGRFGLGFLSVLAVADCVRVHTRRAGSPAGAGSEWLWSGGLEYELRAESRAEVGTEVELRLKPEFAHFTQAGELERLVCWHVPLVPSPILVNDGGDPRGWIDTWLDPSVDSEAGLDTFVDALAPRLPQLRDCLHVFSGSRDGVLRFCLGFPAEATSDPASVTVCRCGVFVGYSEAGVLHPRWGWLHGLIDLGIGPLTLARDTIRQQDELTAVKAELARAASSELVGLARRAPRTFERVLTVHRAPVARAAAEDPDSAGLRGHYLFDTTLGLLDFAGMLRRSELVRGSRRIWCLRRPPETDVRWMAARSRGMLAAYLQDDAELALLKGLVDDTGNAELVEHGLGLQHPGSGGRAALAPKLEVLLAEIAAHLGPYGIAIEHLPTGGGGLLALLEVAGGGFGRTSEIHSLEGRIADDVERFEESLSTSLYRAPVHGRLFVNASSPVLARLAASRRGPVELLAGALLASAAARSPTVLATGWQETVEKLIARGLAALGDGVPAPQEEETRPAVEHVVCFFAHDFEAHRPVLAALRTVLEKGPFYWEVRSAEEEMADPRVFDNVLREIRRCDVLIGDVSNSNPNVLMEVGLGYGLKARERVVLLRAEGSRGFANLEGLIYCEYRAPGLLGNWGAGLTEQLRQWFMGATTLDGIRGAGPYLGYRPLQGELLGASQRARLEHLFPDPRDFLACRAEFVAEQTNLPVDLARRVQDKLDGRLRDYDSARP